MTPSVQRVLDTLRKTSTASTVEWAAMVQEVEQAGSFDGLSDKAWKILKNAKENFQRFNPYHDSGGRFSSGGGGGGGSAGGDAGASSGGSAGGGNETPPAADARVARAQTALSRSPNGASEDTAASIAEDHASMSRHSGLQAAAQAKSRHDDYQRNNEDAERWSAKADAARPRQPATADRYEGHANKLRTQAKIDFHMAGAWAEVARAKGVPDSMLTL